MKRMGAFASQFSGMVLFWVTYAIVGLKPAIAGVLLLVVGELVWRYHRREPLRPLFLVTSALAIASGVIDLYAVSPFAIKFEGVATNLLFAGIFTVGAFGQPSLAQQYAERFTGKAFNPENPSLGKFFKLFTLFWAGYFLFRAVFCLATGLWLPLPAALKARAIVGSLTLLIMVGVSLRAKLLFLALNDRGWL